MNGVTDASNLCLFTAKMMRKLEENDHKRGWHRCDMSYLFACLRKEVDELEKAVREARISFDEEGPHSTPDAMRIAHEAADVANFAFMIQDLCGGGLEHP